MSDTLPAPVITPGRESFDDVVLPHLDAAYRLARWLMRNEHDAEVVLQRRAPVQGWNVSLSASPVRSSGIRRGSRKVGWR